MPKVVESKRRAVGYCRTSGEGQRDNTSIPRQKDAIKAKCKLNGWEFVQFYVDECKSGSTIAGRDAFQKMIADARSGKFDVIVPYDVSRFARDGADIIDQAKLLRSQCQVAIEDSKGQFSNLSYRNAMSNFVHAGFAEHERLVIMERTIGGKLRRAQEGIPCTGRLPYGRTFDRKTKKWGIDAEKQKLFQELAERYVAGESLEALAAESPLGLSYSQIWKNLKFNCGDTWIQKFEVAALDINETVTFKIPRLLPEKLLEAVHQQMEAKRTFDHAQKAKRSGRFLLQGHLFCAGCGRLMTPTTRASGLRLYKHNPRSKNCPLKPRPSVRADLIEPLVISDLFHNLGNPAAIDRAIKTAIPEKDDREKRRSQLESQLAKLDEKRDRIMELDLNGRITKDRADQEHDRLNVKERELRSELDEIDSWVAEFEMAEAGRPRLYVQREPDGTIFIYDDNGEIRPGGNSLGDLLSMSTVDRKRLVDAAFGAQAGKKPVGVYLTPGKGESYRPKPFNYVIRGGIVVENTGVTQSRSSDRTQ